MSLPLRNKWGGGIGSSFRGLVLIYDSKKKTLEWCIKGRRYIIRWPLWIRLFTQFLIRICRTGYRFGSCLYLKFKFRDFRLNLYEDLSTPRYRNLENLGRLRTSQLHVTSFPVQRSTWVGVGERRKSQVYDPNPPFFTSSFPQEGDPTVPP